MEKIIGGCLLPVLDIFCVLPNFCKDRSSNDSLTSETRTPERHYLKIYMQVFFDLEKAYDIVEIQLSNKK